MTILLNLLFTIWFVYYSFRIYNRQNLLCIQNPCRNEPYPINRNLHFLLFSVATAMLFLGSFSLVKYAYSIILLLFIALTSFQLKFEKIVCVYIVFLLWCCFSLLNSIDKVQGIMMLIKYSLPLLYLWLGYNAINNKEDFLLLLKKTNLIMVIYALFIGGFSSIILPFVYNTLLYKSGGLFIAYASLADFFSALFVIPLTLYIIYRKKIYLLSATWILLSTILETVRTGLGGIALATSSFILVIYKLKAIPYILIFVILSIATIYLVPSFKEKMFINDRESTQVYKNGTLDLDNIQSNGREVIWKTNLAKFYKPNPITGSGLGNSVQYTKENFVVKLIHSDYVQILCDTGLVGIILFGLFFLVTFLKIGYCTIFHKDDFILLSGAMALGSCLGTFFSMAFDNVVTYSQQAFIFPFVFIGIFLKAVDLYKLELINIHRC